MVNAFDSQDCAPSHFVLLSGEVPTSNPNLPDPDRERLVSAAPVGDDSSFELKLRPQRLAEFIGQKKVKENLHVAIQAAKSRGEAMDHVLLYGPPGLGKTTLANIIANELGVHFQPTAAPLLQIKGDLTAIITNLQDKQVLFIDEIHRLQPVLEELLYSALEDYKLDIIIGQGPSARTHTLEVKPFTFIGATTRAGLISAPLRARFGIVLRLEFYTPADLQVIVERSAEILGVEIDKTGAKEIAGRSRGTPRIANRLLRRVRDYAQVRGAGNIDEPTAKAALEMLEVDQYGFDEVDRRLLLTIIEKYQGGPVGVNTLAAVLAEEPDAIEEIYEPFLMQIGFLDRTQRGRVATQLAYDHFGITPHRRQSFPLLIQCSSALCDPVVNAFLFPECGCRRRCPNSVFRHKTFFLSCCAPNGVSCLVPKRGFGKRTGSLRLGRVVGRELFLSGMRAVLVLIVSATLLPSAAFSARVLQSQEPATTSQPTGAQSSQQAPAQQQVPSSQRYPSPSAQVPEPPVKDPTVKPAPTPQTPTPSITIPRLEHGPTLDDFLSMQPQGDIATRMAKVTGFTQRNPHDGEPVSEKTEAYLGYDQKNFYAVFRLLRRSQASSRPHVAAAKTSTTTTTSKSSSTPSTTAAAPTPSRPRLSAFSGTPSGPKPPAKSKLQGHFDTSFDTVWDSKGKVTSQRLRRLDLNSIQEPSLPRGPSSGVGTHPLPRHHPQKRRLVLAPHHLQKWKAASARPPP